MNAILTTNLNLEMLNEFSYSELNGFSTILVEAITNLTDLLNSSVDINDTEKETEYKEYLKFATSNKNKIDACLINKEADKKVEGLISPIFLN